MQRGQPTVLDYTDFRTYLADWELYMRKHKPHFSYQWVQQAAGLGSRSHFLSVLQGRKLSDQYVERYVQLLQLNTLEDRHFRNLVNLDLCKTPQERKLLWNKLIQESPRLRPLQIEAGSQLGLFSNWILFPLISLLEIVPHTNDPAKLASWFLPDLTETQIAEALQLLQDLGFVFWNKDLERWSITHKFIESTSPQAKEALWNWQRQWLHLGQYMQSNREVEQNLSTLTIGISKESRPQILDILSKARKEILDIVRADQNPTSVHQLNFHVFAVAQNPILEKESDSKKSISKSKSVSIKDSNSKVKLNSIKEKVANKVTKKVSAKIDKVAKKGLSKNETLKVKKLSKINSKKMNPEHK